MLKTAFFGVFLCAVTAVTTANAQIMIDLDVLDMPSPSSVAEPPVLKVPVVKEEKKKPAVQKKPVKQKVKQEKKKTTVKKPVKKKEVKQKNVQKTTQNVPVPRAQPVPEVKVITKKPEPPIQPVAPEKPVLVPVKNTVAQETVSKKDEIKTKIEEKDPVETAVKEEKIPVVEKKLEEKNETKPETKINLPEKQPEIVPLKKETETVLKKEEPVVYAEKTENDVPFVDEKSPFDLDVSLTDAERSDILMRYIPQESQTMNLLKEGKSLRDILEFEPNSIMFAGSSTDRLDVLVDYLQKNIDKRIVVLTYTSGTAPEYGRERQLTLRRALTVRSYLAEKGIRTLRVEIRSLGTNGAGNQYPNRADIVIYSR